MENLKGKDHLQNQGVDGKIILQQILECMLGRCGLDASGSGQESVAGSCEYGTEPSDFI